MSHDVFISHSSRDKAVGDAACALLEARGHRCWIAPRDIMPGKEWGEAIIDGIRGARAFVLIFSGNANQSSQVSREVERASSLGLPVIPFRIEDVAPSKTLEYFMSSPHWLDALTPPLQAHLDYLADVLDHLLSGDPPAPGARPPASPHAGPPAAPVASPGTARARLLRTAAIAVGCAALPILAALAGIEPPWPPAIAWISAMVIVVALLVGRVLDPDPPPRRRRLRILAAAGTAIAGLFLYLALYAGFVMAVPGDERIILGYQCNEMAELLHPHTCPNLDQKALEEMGWDPANLFTASSILAIRIALVGAWLTLMLGLVAAAGWALSARGEEPPRRD